MGQSMGVPQMTKTWLNCIFQTRLWDMKVLYYLLSTIGNSIMETLIHNLTNFTNYIFINTTCWAQIWPKITFYNKRSLKTLIIISKHIKTVIYRLHRRIGTKLYHSKLILGPKWAQNTIFAVIMAQERSQTHG